LTVYHFGNIIANTETSLSPMPFISDATTSPGERSAAAAVQARPAGAAAVFVVRPLQFGRNPQTAATNSLQAAANLTELEIGCVNREFDQAVESIGRAGIEVCVFEPPAGVWAPDAVFPNNWISTHHDGTVVIYPMMAPNRRLERQTALLDRLAQDCHFQVRRTIDLTWLEGDQQYVEGTGSLVLDRANRIAYAALSPRTTESGVECATRSINHEACLFTATHASGAAVYHTNVMLSVGTEIALGGFEMIRDSRERAQVLQRLESTAKRSIALTEEQIGNFAANALELRSPSGALLVMSTRAWNSLDALQKRTIEQHVRVCPVDVGTIERFGGGGIRCMLAEIFLPRAALATEGL
jgi:hypothetical protein